MSVPIMGFLHKLKHNCLVAVLVCASASSLSASQWADELKAHIDEKVQEHFINRSQVGIVVGVIKNGETHVWSYGERVLGSNEGPTGDTFFEMGSITKTYTATLLALEVVKGRIRLTDQVKAFWRELDGTDAGEITLEQLATHRSGLPRLPDNFAPADPLNPYQDYDEAKLSDFLKTFKRQGKDPFPYAYSNVGFGLLGYLLAVKHGGESFGPYLQKNLLVPLGLSDTKPVLEADDLRRAAQGYGNFFQPLPFWDLNIVDGGGVLKTTVNDLLKYMKFNLDANTSELGNAVDLAHQPRALAENADVKIGLAWHMMKMGAYSVATHSGGTGGYRAHLILDRTKRVGAVVLSNTDMAPTCVLAPVFDVKCKDPGWVVVDPMSQNKFVGAYHCEATKLSIDVFLDNGLLGIHPKGQDRARLWAKSELEYRIPDVGATIVFKDAGHGQSDAFVLTQHGQRFDFLRKK